jgi:hypothetical protein
VDYTLFPAPRTAKFGAETFDFRHAEWLRLHPELSPQLKRHAVALGESLSELFARPLRVTAGRPHRGRTLLTMQPASRDLEPQAYDLESSEEGIVLTGGDEAGLFYGLLTLEQLLAQTGARVPAFRISDAPDFPSRGIMLDVSRCKVPKMETLQRVVDLMARLKLNQLQLYTEHTFAFSEHEVVWHDASPMTAQDVLLLDAYCRERFVELVPNLNSFGHFERWLRHPEYKHLAECPDGLEYRGGGRSAWGNVLKPNRESLRFIASLYEELLPNFQSRLFNVGCDETGELGKGWSRKKCEERGTTRVYLDFLLGIHRLVRKHGRTMMFWGDIILHEPGLIRELPEGIIGLVWGYEATHPFDKQCAQFKKAGVPFCVCPGTSSWNSLTGRTSNCIENLASAARNGLKYGAVGYLNTDWGDGGHHQYLPVSYPGFFAGAAFSWGLRANRDVDLADAMDALAFQDESGTLGKLLLDLGRVLDLVPKRPRNRSIFNQLLFSDIGAADVLEGVTAGSLKKCLIRFDALAERVGSVRPGADDGELVKAELLNAIEMARCGALRGLLGLGDADVDRTALRHLLQHVISQHEALWLARNRPGGLNESSGRLRRRLEEL